MKKLDFCFIRYLLLVSTISVLLLIIYCLSNPFLFVSEARISKSDRGLIISDPNLKIEEIVSGLEHPSTMTFLGKNDILVLEKDNGTVRRILNGSLLPEPILDVNVSNKRERGMLGIATSKNITTNTTYVFIYYTESKAEGSDICPSSNRCMPGNDPLGNRLYRYELTNNKLMNPKLLLDLPATPIPAHNGGRIVVGPDNNLYVVIGDLDYRSITQNFPHDPDSNGTSVIYRINQDGEAVGGILGEKDPVNKFFAYGIRNSFGMDFDPVTGRLWDTENGPSYADEINLVDPGFNSGWRKVQGIWNTSGAEDRGKFILNESGLKDHVILNPEGLETFEGRGKYSAPEFMWLNTSAPTGIKFLDSEKFGKQYQNDLFIGDFHGGNIYHFELDKNRTMLVLHPPLADKIANTAKELEGIIFAEGFDSISDLQVNPYDGYLYVVSFGQGKIYRISPATAS